MGNDIEGTRLMRIVEFVTRVPIVKFLGLGKVGNQPATSRLRCNP